MIYKIRLILLIFLSILTVGCTYNHLNVTTNNVDEFKHKFVTDLPTGTPKENIESYLNSKMISFTYLDKKNVIYASIPNIGRFRLIYTAGLFIHIKLDKDQNLASIAFDLQYG